MDDPLVPPAFQAAEKLHQDFLHLLQNSQSRLQALERSEILALCLAALSAAGGGSPAVFLLAGADGLTLELSSGALPCAPEQLNLPLSPEEQEILGQQRFHPEALEALRRLIHEAFHTEEAFAATLMGRGRTSGVLILPPPAERSFRTEELSLLGHLAVEIGTILESAEVFATLMEHVMVDELTGLFNHRYLSARLPQEIARASRHGHPLSLLFCDVDDFGSYTEHNGRISGYGLLTKISTLLKARGLGADATFSFRTSDIAVRYGGEQFVVILPETPKSGATTKAENLRRMVESMGFFGGETQPLGKVTLSIGVASFPEDSADAVSLLEAADLALNQAKERGKNRTQTV